MSVLNLTIDEIVAKTTDLPTLPTAALAVMREADSSVSNAQSVAKHLSQDQALTARVLRLANSAFYGLARKVQDPQEAVVILGMRTVKSLAMIASTYPILTKPLLGYEIGGEALWRHSFATGLGAQLIATKTRHANPDSAFVSGLLHNIGKLTLSVWLENRLGGMTQIAYRAGVGFDQIEKQLLGFDHADVGAHLAESWNLPAPLVGAIRFHHHPTEDVTSQDLTDCVHLADHLAMDLGIGLSGEGNCYVFDEGAFERTGLNREGFEELKGPFMQMFDQQQSLFERAA